MGYVGLSLILATALVVLVHPDLRRQFLTLFRNDTPEVLVAPTEKKPLPGPKPKDATTGPSSAGRSSAIELTSASVPPPPTIEAPDDSEQSTPKASAAKPSAPVPSFNLNGPLTSHPPNLLPSSMPPFPNRLPPATSNSMAPPPIRQPPLRTPPTSSPSLMPPPTAAPSRPSRLASFPAANSPQRTAPPAPHRGLTAPPSGLAPPPIHSSAPTKPSRKVMLTPGHSPLDWARISGPNSDLRGLPAGSPYLKVTPGMLKMMTGRRGKDAWMALGGKVYNVTPYAEFHPGGVPELMRGAGRDATKIYGEVHPWVNYENMLQACLVGILVEEKEQDTAGGNMESMD